MTEEELHTHQMLDWLKDAILTNRKLLQVIANSGKLHEIGGFSYGRTSVGDPYVLLYPDHPNMIQKVCRVYPQDFDKLPYHVPTVNIPQNVTDGNPDKKKSKAAGNYRNCAKFTIATVEGKKSANSNMGPEIRFYDVIELTRNRDDELRQSVPEISEISDSEKTEISDHSLDAVVAREGVNNVLFGTSSNTSGKRLHESPAPISHKYGDGTEPPDNPATLEIFDAYATKFHKAPKNGYTLKTWHEATIRNQPVTA